MMPQGRRILTMDAAQTTQLIVANDDSAVGTACRGNAFKKGNPNKRPKTKNKK